MKVTVKGGLKRKDNTAGFVNIENWKGATMRINKTLLDSVMRILTSLDEELIDVENLQIGISAESNMFCVFLDPNKTVACAIMGKIEEGTENI